MNKNRNISPTLIKRLKIQGYCNLTDYELKELNFGNRFAYILCSIIVFIGVFTINIQLLIAMMIVALLGVSLPYHPFDYIYNHLLRYIMKKPKLPPRSKQIKFACSIATIWLATTIGLFSKGFTIAGYIVGGFLFISHSWY